MHTLKSIVPVIRELEPAFAASGYHLGLTGSVLFKGESEKDADLIVYPHDPAKQMADPLFFLFLRSLGFVFESDCEPDEAYRRRVLRTRFRNTRVDLFLFD